MVLTAAIGLSAGAEVVINEVCYSNSKVADETGDCHSDWIELYNAGAADVNILNYAVGDANPYEEAHGVRLPDYTIPAGGYLLVFADGDTGEYTAWTNASDIAAISANAVWRYRSASGEPDAAWKTNTYSDAAWPSGISPLGYNDTRQNLDCATVLDFGGDASGRYPAAYFRKTFMLPDPSVVTGLLVRARINDGMVLYLNGTEAKRIYMPGGAVGSATLASTGVPSTLWTNFLLSASGLVRGTNLVAVEVHQASVSSVDLIMDMTVTALVHAQVPVVHGQFGLSKEGENVHLFNSSLTRIHKFDAPPSEPGDNRSYGLTVDGVTGTCKIYSMPTPGFSNATYNEKYQETLTAQTPTFSVPPGVYPVNQNVVLSTPSASNYKIYYTLDGSDPRDASSFVYSGNSVLIGAQSPVSSGLSWRRTNPVEIGNAENMPSAAWRAPVGTVGRAVVLRAITVDSSGQSCSSETRGAYFIGAAFTNRTLPIVSLITDTNNLFGFVSGLFVPGKCYADSEDGYGSNRWGKPYANYHQDDDNERWERPVKFELFEPSQSTASVSQTLGMAMHGGGTRAIPQKTLYFLARQSEYGSELVDYALFPNEAATAYKRFLLRNSGNDWYGPDYDGVATMMKDAVFHRMVKGLDLSVMAYRPVVAFINGEYWGLYNLRESFDKHYLATRYGLDADNMDLLMHEEDPDDQDKVKITRIDGDSGCDEDYEALINWIQTNSLASDAHYLQVQNWIDVTNHADYIIAETFFGNTDWPINNCDFWRAHTNETATCGPYGDMRWRWMLYDLDVAGEEDEGASFNMFEYLSSSKMTGAKEPGFLINQLWANPSFRQYFVTRYANLLNTTFRPERLAAIVEAAAALIQPEMETHFRRWGRTATQAQWQAAVDAALVQYTAARHDVSWNQLDAFFELGGTGLLTVRNSDSSGTGGRFTVNGVVIDTTTDGVTNRAAWTGTFFRSLAVPVRAVPDDGYVFDGWAGTAVTNPSPSLFVGGTPITLTARFRLAAASACVPTGYEQWQTENYTENQILGGVDAAPEAASGCADMSNFELYAFGMGRFDGLSDDQRKARATLSIHSRNSALWLGYTRRNKTFGDVDYTLKTAASLNAPIAWSNAVWGADLDPVAVTNILDEETWYYEVRLPAASSERNTRFYKVEAAQRE